MTRFIAICIVLCGLSTAKRADAFEVRVRADARLDADISAAGTVAQVSGTLRDDLGRGLPQRELKVQIDARRSGQTLVSHAIHTDARGQFALQDELPPGDYEVFIRFDETEHLDGTALSASVRLEPLPVAVRAFGPAFVYGRAHPAWVSGRAAAGRVPFQGSADVLVNGRLVGRMELDPTGRGTFDVVDALQEGENRVTIRTAGSAYRDASEASVELRFSSDVQIEASIEERLEGLSRGLAVFGTVSDAQGPLPGVRVQTRFEPLLSFDDDVELAGEGESQSSITESTVTDRNGRFVGFITSKQVFDGRWLGEATFVPPIGEPVTVGAGVLELDSRAYRWAVNGFGVTAIFAGILALLGRLGLLLLDRWRAWKIRRDRVRREREAMEAVEQIVPVFIPPDELGAAVKVSREDVGGMAWDVWRRASIPGAQVEVVCGEDRREVTTDTNGRFRFVELPAGDWQLSVRKHGFMPGSMKLEIPHEGGLSHFRLDVVAVPLKIRRLYGTVLEHSVGADLWGSLSPRQIEARIEDTFAASSPDDRERLRAEILAKLQTPGQSDYEGTEVVAALTEIVEEAYFSGRTYGEEAFRLARALALDLRARGPEAP